MCRFGISIGNFDYNISKIWIWLTMSEKFIQNNLGAAKDNFYPLIGSTWLCPSLTSLHCSPRLYKHIHPLHIRTITHPTNTTGIHKRKEDPKELKSNGILPFFPSPRCSSCLGLMAGRCLRSWPAPGLLCRRHAITRYCFPVPLSPNTYVEMNSENYMHVETAF